MSASELILSPFKSIKSAITQQSHRLQTQCVVTYFAVCNLNDDDSCHSIQIHSSSYSLTQSNIKRSTAWNCFQNSCLQIYASAYHKHFKLTTDPQSPEVTNLDVAVGCKVSLFKTLNTHIYAHLKNKNTRDEHDRNTKAEHINWQMHLSQKKKK